MDINAKYIVVERLQEEDKEGFKTVEVQDNFVYKGKIVNLPEIPTYISNRQLVLGDVVLFAKYSPDSHEIDKVKFVAVSDVLAII